MCVYWSCVHGWTLLTDPHSRRLTNIVLLYTIFPLFLLIFFIVVVVQRTTYAVLTSRNFTYPPRGLEAVRSCSEVYLETYTSLLTSTPTSTLEAFYGLPIIEADRETVESNAERILQNARTSNVAFLVVGDPYGATTHTDLELRARHAGIPVEKIHNASIMNAIGAAGLQLYKYGETVSIVFFTDTWRPDSFYDKILKNRKNGLHTLCLLDIKTKEPTMESLARGKPVYEPPRFMTVNQAIDQLLEVEEKRGEGAYGEGTMCVGVARVGSRGQCIVAGEMGRLRGVEFGGPLHSLVIAGEMHELEEEMLREFAIDRVAGGEVDQ